MKILNMQCLLALRLRTGNGSFNASSMPECCQPWGSDGDLLLNPEPAASSGGTGGLMAFWPRAKGNADLNYLKLAQAL